MSEFNNSPMPSNLSGESDNRSEIENKKEIKEKMESLINHFFMQKNKNAAVSAFDKIMKYANINNISLSNEEWDKLKAHVNKFV
ncbi:MAG: hypothetical protein WC070_00720 [Candidatus Magasanikbacteria bacterium]